MWRLLKLIAYMHSMFHTDESNLTILQPIWVWMQASTLSKDRDVRTNMSYKHKHTYIL